MMRRTLLALALATAATTAAAAPADLNTIRNYATRALPRCENPNLVVTPMDASGPSGFTAYQLKLTSSDQYCGTAKYLLHSPKSDTVLLGTVIPLPMDGRPLATRVSEKTSELLRKPHTASVAPFPLPDGLRAVAISRATPYGQFAYHGFVDASGQFLIVGSRGNLRTDPAQTLRDALNLSNAVRRGAKSGPVEIIELSDFQCPSCARAHKQLEPLIQKNLDKITYLRLDLPLFEQHEWSVPAAAAARAIQKTAPAKYWAYVDHVFKNQEQIEKMSFDKFIYDYLEDHDIPRAAFDRIYTSTSERQAILEQVSRAFDVGVASTPTFIINGQMSGYGSEGKMVNEIIAASLKAAPAKKPAPKAAAKKK